MSNFVKVRGRLGYYSDEVEDLIINTELIFGVKRKDEEYLFFGSVNDNVTFGIIVDPANAAIIFKAMGISL